MPTLRATLTDDIADPPGKANILNPVQHHVTDGNFAQHGLTARLEINIESEAALIPCTKDSGLDVLGLRDRIQHANCGNH
jgi:hypothetical protein